MFHNPIDYFLSVRLKIFIFQILQLGRTPNEFRRKPIPSPKEFWRILLHRILSDGEKRKKNLHCQLSIFKESTEKQRQMIYSISIFLFSGLTCGFFFVIFLSIIFLYVLLNFICLFSAQHVSYTYFSFYLPWF